MKTTALILSTAFVFLAAPLSTARADEKAQEVESHEALTPPSPEMVHPGLQERMMYKLSLSKEQKQKMRAIREAKRTQADAIHSEHSAHIAKLQAALKAGTDDEVRKIFSELQVTNQKLSALHLEGMLETRALLTPEQRETFSKMTHKLLGGHKKRRHGRKKQRD